LLGTADADDGATGALVVTTWTGGTLTAPLGRTLGRTDGMTLPLPVGMAVESSSSSSSPPLPPVGRGGLVCVRRVVTGLPPLPPLPPGLPGLELAMGQTVVPMGISVVVSRPGQPVVTEGGHEVMV